MLEKVCAVIAVGAFVIGWLDVVIGSLELFSGSDTVRARTSFSQQFEAPPKRDTFGR